MIENLEADFISASGSIYYYTKEGVYRLSTHWGRAATCRWRLQTQNRKTQEKRLGYANWECFFKDNDVEKLYFITMNPTTKQYEYFHKEEPIYSGKEVLRTANETQKKLRQIKTISTETKWAKHISHTNIDKLKSFLITGLIETNKPLFELKQNYIE